MLTLLACYVTGAVAVGTFEWLENGETTDSPLKDVLLTAALWWFWLPLGVVYRLLGKC